MRKAVTDAIAILDFVLIYLTALLLLLNFNLSFSWFDLFYNIVYVILNVATLLLNLWLLYKDKNN